MVVDAEFRLGIVPSWMELKKPVALGWGRPAGGLDRVHGQILW
jgi:hypothetical protein